jgi:hypothetical protein
MFIGTHVNIISMVFFFLGKTNGENPLQEETRRKTEGRGPNQASPNPTTYQYI